MMTYDDKSAGAQAVPAENQAIFMMLLRDGLLAAGRSTRVGLRTDGGSLLMIGI